MTQNEFLRLCVYGGRDEIEEALISGADVSEPGYINGAEVPPVFVAVMEENAEAVKVLIENGANPGDGIMAAIVRGKKKLLKLLVDCGADVNRPDNQHRTPLLFAVTSNNPKVLKWLIEFGADVNMKTETGYSALTFTLLMHDNPEGNYRKFNPGIVSELMKAGADYGEAMMLAGKTGSREFIDLLLKNGADINRPCDGVQSPLAAALFMGKEEIDSGMVDFLVSYGANVNEIIPLGDGTLTTPLNVSITMERPDIESLFLFSDANPNFRDPTGRTALVYAVMTGVEFVKLLLEYNADPDIPDNDGRTPLMLAALDVGTEPEILETLIHYGANVNAQDKDGMTALIWTVAGRDRTPGFLMSSLVRTGGLRAEGWESWFLLAVSYIAMKREAQLNSIKLLVEHGADVNLADKNGMTPLMCAMMNYDDEVIEILTKSGKKKKEE